MPPSKYAFDEIANSMFLPLMKKALMRDIGGRRQYKGHMPLMNQIRRHMPPSKYASHEIGNSMFLPLKKSLIGGIGGRRQN